MSLLFSPELLPGVVSLVLLAGLVLGRRFIAVSDCGFGINRPVTR